MKIGVFEEKGSSFTEKITSSFPKVQTLRLSESSDGGVFDVIVWQRRSPAVSLKKPKTRVLICPSCDALSAVGSCIADDLITVGTGEGDTLALSSSIMHSGGMASLKREIQTVDGRSVLPQDLYLDPYEGSIDEKLMQKAAELVMHPETTYL